MKPKEQILLMLNYLNKKREEAIGDNIFSVALSIAGQIELLKWVLDIKDEN